jgi:cell division transport system ATP-binding protein
MIHFVHVSKSYSGGHIALDDVCLSVDRGEFVVVSGPSGAGKSTLLKAITFEILPDRGEVIVETFRSTALRRRDVPLLRRQLGVIYQDFKLLKDRTIFENVAFALRITGVDHPRAIKERTLGALHRVGLAHRRHAHPRELSGGEQQRVGLARAIVLDPLYLLADEPTGNLDPRAADELFALLREVNLAGTGVIVVTHGAGRADPHRDRLIHIENGVLRELPRSLRHVMGVVGT